MLTFINLIFIKRIIPVFLFKTKLNTDVILYIVRVFCKHTMTMMSLFALY